MDFSSSNRHLIIISGKQSDCLNCAKKMCKNLKTLVLDDPKKANDFLGQEFDAVIFNSFDGFNANAFGVVSGTIRGGGFLLFLKPASYPKSSLFLKRFESLLNTNNNAVFIDPLANHEPLSLLKNLPSSSLTTCVTDDQSKAVDAIIHVVKGHRRRPLVMTADRGRGKSASLGIAAAKLIEDGYKNIIVCAPSKKSAAVIFQFAGGSGRGTLKFYSPDDLNQKLPKADLVLIDEAATIPVSLLVRFLKHYSRIVFSSTEHGYEGSGRGFSINFHKELDAIAPDWKACKLNTPIRWNENDALEAFVFEALLLNAEPVDGDLIADSTLENCQTIKINKSDLLKNANQLKTLFGLLVSAHYQTKPSDLVQLLDDDTVTIHTLQFQQKIIAVILLIEEGGIDPNLCHDIYAGTRRLKGHLVAQSLAANMGIEEAPVLLGERISRIAVHPSLQQQGFGSHLLAQVATNSKADYLSTSFGATVPVIQFWQKAGFKPVYLGIKRDASSGTHSVVMLYKKTHKSGGVYFLALKRFSQHFPHLLSEPFQNLEADIALALLSEPDNHDKQDTRNDSEIKELNAFATEQRGYENSIYPLWKLVCSKLAGANLSEAEKRILLYKILQKRAWADVVKAMNGVSGKKEVLILLRKAVGHLLLK